MWALRTLQHPTWSRRDEHPSNKLLAQGGTARIYTVWRTTRAPPARALPRYSESTLFDQYYHIEKRNFDHTDQKCRLLRQGGLFYWKTGCPPTTARDCQNAPGTQALSKNGRTDFPLGKMTQRTISTRSTSTSPPHYPGGKWRYLADTQCQPCGIPAHFFFETLQKRAEYRASFFLVKVKDDRTGRWVATFLQLIKFSGTKVSHWSIVASLTRRNAKEMGQKCDKWRGARC